MGRYLIILLLSINCFSQNTSFSVKKDKLFWENVYISTETNVPQLIKRHSKLKIDTISKNIFKGHGSGLKNTCDDASAILDNEFNFDFEIELREGKYRVTISKLVFNQSGKSSKNKKTASENYYLENGIIKPTGLKDLACLEGYFNRIFSFTTLYKNKS